MVVMVPVENAESIGLRKIVSSKEALKALELLNKEYEQANTDWKTRNQQNLDLLKKGTISDIAQVVKTLYDRSISKELPIQGRKLFDRAYYAEGYYPLKTMNASRCLFSDKYKGSHWSAEKISSFCEQNGFSYKEKDKDGKTIKPDPEKVAAAISKKWGKNRTSEECAAVFEEICPDSPNPFGEIGDYSMDGDTGIKYDSWGRGRRGHRRRRGGWGGYGGGGGSDSVAGATKMKKAKMSDVTFASNLDDSYRRKLKKLRDSSRKDLSK